LLQHRDLICCEFFLRRHLQIVIEIAHGFNEQAVVHLAGHERRAVFAAGLPARF
jgi:hypothetical protein